MSKIKLKLKYKNSNNLDSYNSNYINKNEKKL